MVGAENSLQGANESAIVQGVRGEHMVKVIWCDPLKVTPCCPARICERAVKVLG